MTDNIQTGVGAPVVVLDEGALGEVLTLQRAAFALEVIDSYPGYTDPLRQTLEELAEEQSAAGAAVLGIRDNGRLIAALRVIPDGEDILLARLSVAPDRVREGLGKTLMTAAVEYVEETYRKAQRILFHADGSNKWIIRWYQNLGFEVVRPGTEHAPGDWILAKELSH